MGWLWATPSAPQQPSPPNTSAAASTTTRKTEAETFDDEITKFFAGLEAESSSRAPPPAPAPVDQPPKPTKITSPSPPAASKPTASSWSAIWGSSSPKPQAKPEASPPPVKAPAERPLAPTSSKPGEPPVPLLDPITESLLPTTMSCRAAFDSAFYCQSVGGQWNAIYRSGTMRSCSEHWEDFWFCMRTRSFLGRSKEETIQDWYRRKEMAKYGADQPSSTDVWEPREERVEPGTAFREPFARPDISDEEWRKLELERRRRVREELEGNGK